MDHPIPAGLLEIAEALVPDAPVAAARLAEHGNMHHVVLFPGVAAVRISKRSGDAADLPRRVDILRAVAAAGLPFDVPEPLTPVTAFGDRAAVAVSWIGGEPLPQDTGDPATLAVALAELLEALRDVEISPALQAVLRTPSRHTDDGLGWADVLRNDVIPRLPPRWQDEVRHRLDALLALALDDDDDHNDADAAAPPRLVHGDLGGTNIHFAEDGKLTGVLDWDLAILSDPAIDAALVATWHGWDVLKAAVDDDTYRRAQAWHAPVDVAHLHAVFSNKPLSSIDGYVASIAAWLKSQEKNNSADRNAD